MSDGVGKKKHIHQSGGMLFGRRRWWDVWRLRRKPEFQAVACGRDEPSQGASGGIRVARARRRRSPVGWYQRVQPAPPDSDRDAAAPTEGVLPVP